MDRARLRLLLFAAALCCAQPAAGADASPPPLPAPASDALPLGPSLEQRLAEIQRRVQRVAAYPAIARARGVEGSALVAFEIGPEGEPREIRTERSSGSVALDRAAERAVRDAAPLPNVYGRISVPVVFALR
jgi:protein TonB